MEVAKMVKEGERCLKAKQNAIRRSSRAEQEEDLTRFEKNNVGMERIEGSKKSVAGESVETSRTKQKVSFDLDARDVPDRFGGEEEVELTSYDGCHPRASHQTAQASTKDQTQKERRLRDHFRRWFLLECRRRRVRRRDDFVDLLLVER